MTQKQSNLFQKLPQVQRRGNRRALGARAPRFCNKQRSALFILENSPFSLRKKCPRGACPLSLRCFPSPCTNLFCRSTVFLTNDIVNRNPGLTPLVQCEERWEGWRGKNSGSSCCHHCSLVQASHCSASCAYAA